MQGVLHSQAPSQAGALSKPGKEGYCALAVQPAKSL